MIQSPLQKAAHSPVQADRSVLPDGADSELLGRFVSYGDEAAFAALARRYSRLIRSVCSRALSCREDVEDATQATLIVFARRADTIRKSEALASWLYGVAYRTANNARKSIERRAVYESHASSRSVESPVSQAALREIQAILDEETQSLPDKLRAPFVLCCLEGKSKGEAAEILGWKEGTVSGRAHQARCELRQRLVRRGVSLSSALCAVALTGNWSSAAAPTRMADFALHWKPLESGAAPRSVLLAEEVVKAMATGKGSSLVTMSIVLAVVSIGTGLLLAGAAVQKPLEGKKAQATPEPGSELEKRKVGKDRYGDPLPRGAVARLGTVRFRHGSTVTGLAFHPNGKTLISGSYDKTIRLWDVHTRREIQRFRQLNGSVMQLSVSANGKRVAALDMGTIYLADLTSGKLLRPNFQKGSFYSSVALSPDGSIVVASGRNDFQLRAWNISDGKLLQVFKGHEQRVRSIAFSPNGKLIVSGSDDRSVRAWDLKTGKEILHRKSSGAIAAVAFSRDGKIVAEGGAEGKLRLWTLSNGKMLHELGKHFSGVLSILFSPDGKSVASAGGGSVIYLWDLKTGKLQRKFWGGSEAIAFSPDSRTIASGGHDCTIRLWDVATGKERPAPADGHREKLRAVAVTPDGSEAATTTFPGGRRSIRLWETATGKEIRQFTDKAAFQNILALSPNGNIIASDRTLWDRRTGKVIGRIKGQDYSIEAIAFSPDSRSLAMATTNISSGKDRMIRIWDVESCKELSHFCKHPVHSLACSPDGRMIAAGSGQGPITLWTLKGKLLRSLQKGHIREVRAVAFSADGKTLASCSFDGDLFLWDVESGEIKHHLYSRDRRFGPVHILTLAFSPDGRMVAAAVGHSPYGAKGHSIVLWEVATGKERLRLQGHEGDIYSLAFAANGKTLVSGSSDTTALVWDVTAIPRANGSGSKDLEKLWADLLKEDAKQSYRAICQMAVLREAVPFLRKHLIHKPASSKKIAQWLKELNHKSFQNREEATSELERLGMAAELDLRRALSRSPTLELRRRLNRLLKKLEGEGRRASRALEVLEMSRAPVAIRLLKDLAEQSSALPQTQEAKAALLRLTKSPE